MGSAERFTLRTQTLGCLPIVNHFLDRMGVGARLATYLPKGDARLRVAPATVIGVVVRNIVVAHRRVYALGGGRLLTIRRCSVSARVTAPRSTTTGWAACSTVSSTRTGPA